MVDELLDLALSAARAAGAVLRDRFRGPIRDVRTKSSATDIVTEADQASEAVILRGIRSERPNDTILGEEGGLARGSSGLRWVVDPLDGTTNFLFGVPQWAVSIACEDADGAVLGVVYDPLRDEMFVARRGKGATLNDQPVRVTEATDLAKSLIATGFAYKPEERRAAARILPDLITQVRDIRRPGAASLDLAWVAAGRFDGYYETPIEHWDVAAGQLLVSEAGGAHAPLPDPVGDRAGLVAAGRGIFDDLRDLVLGLLP